MSRQRIDHRHLLERVLPLSGLPADVRLEAERAVRTGSPEACERAARRAIDALMAGGILVRTGGTDGRVERFLNRESGDAVTVRWSPPDPLLRIPPPESGVPGRVPIDVVREILALDDPLFGAEGGNPASTADIVRSALAVLTRLTRADFTTFVPTGDGESGPVGADEPVARRHAEVIQRVLGDTEPSVAYLPDVRAEPDIAALAPSAEFASVVFASVGRGASRSGPVEGFVEAWSRRPNFLDRDGALAVGLFADQLSETLQKAALLERLVYHDSLTGLYNRHFFNNQLKREMARARRANESFALAIVDIDDFKSANSRFGYYGGNDLLVRVAQILKGSIRPFDVAARWGGEEFALILTAPVGAGEASTITDRLREAVASHPHTVTGLDHAAHEVSLSVSIGVAVFPEDAETGKRLWTAANEALARAKESGKNRVVRHRGGGNGGTGRSPKEPTGG